jgi:hypothetical protein
MVHKKQEIAERLKRQFDEGLGTVYERFRLNYIFKRLIESYALQSVLEFPLYGMTGLDGINSVYFAQKKIPVELVDCDRSRLQKVKGYWELLNIGGFLTTHYMPEEEMAQLDLPDNHYSLVYNFAALWFYHDAGSIINRMIDLSNNLVFISVNNRWQLGYPLRKYLLDKEFFIKHDIDTRWVQMPRVKSILRSRGLEIIEEGCFDTPPWPDTCLPVGKIKEMLGFKPKETGESKWLWSMMAWYAKADPTLEEKVKRFMLIEDSVLPAFIKQFWSHHRYIIAQKRQ